MCYKQLGWASSSKKINYSPYKDDIAMRFITGMNGHRVTQKVTDITMKFIENMNGQNCNEVNGIAMRLIAGMNGNTLNARRLITGMNDTMTTDNAISFIMPPMLKLTGRTGFRLSVRVSVRNHACHIL